MTELATLSLDAIGVVGIISIGFLLRKWGAGQQDHDERMKEIRQNADATCWRINRHILFILLVFSNAIHFFARTVPGYYIQIVMIAMALSQIFLNLGVSMYYKRKFGDFD